MFFLGWHKTSSNSSNTKKWEYSTSWENATVVAQNYWAWAWGMVKHQTWIEMTRFFCGLMGIHFWDIPWHSHSFFGHPIWAFQVLTPRLFGSVPGPLVGVEKSVQPVASEPLWWPTGSIGRSCCRSYKQFDWQAWVGISRLVVKNQGLFSGSCLTSPRT